MSILKLKFSKIYIATVLSPDTIKMVEKKDTGFAHNAECRTSVYLLWVEKMFFTAFSVFWSSRIGLHSLETSSFLGGKESSTQCPGAHRPALLWPTVSWCNRISPCSGKIFTIWSGSTQNPGSAPSSASLPRAWASPSHPHHSPALQWRESRELLTVTASAQSRGRTKWSVVLDCSVLTTEPVGNRCSIRSIIHPGEYKCFFFLESHTSLLRDRWLGVFVLFVLEKNPCVGIQFVMNFLNLLFI